MSSFSLMDVKQASTKGSESLDCPGVCIILQRCDGGTDLEVFETWKMLKSYKDNITALYLGPAAVKLNLFCTLEL